ncbi:MAG: hypothetical protein IH906_03320 [Proteobacteria bacterium]|nr:hypothetical protein [Pseudomonadota bacterium]
MRTVYPDMPFMMVTANTDVDSVRAAGQFGVNAYIVSPFRRSSSSASSWPWRCR